MGFQILTDTDSEKLISVNQWGDIEWQTFEWMFFDARYLQLEATDTPQLNSVESMERTFYFAQEFDADIGHWNVSTVNNMAGIFSYTEMSYDISGWDITNVTNMSAMFLSTNFNHDISDWDVSNVTEYGVYVCL